MDKPVALDASSLKILAELQRDARQTVQAIAEKVGLSTTPCWRRIKDMETSGIIRGYTAVLDRDKIGLSLSVVTEVNLARHGVAQAESFEQSVARSPEIVRCVSATGNSDYILNVVAPDIKHYEHFLLNTVFELPGVTHVRSSIVLKEVKTELKLPIELLADRRRTA